MPGNPQKKPQRKTFETQGMRCLLFATGSNTAWYSRIEPLSLQEIFKSLGTVAGILRNNENLMKQEDEQVLSLREGSPFV